MGITTKSDKDKFSVCIDGELTIYTVQEYKKSLLEKFSADKALELDLNGVDEIDTSGLQLLAAIAKQLSENGSEMSISSLSDVAREALESSRLMAAMKCDVQVEPS